MEDAPELRQKVSVPPFKITVECDKAEDVDSLVAFRKSLHSDARLQRFAELPSALWFLVPVIYSSVPC